jgi:hypothetical protein
VNRLAHFETLLNMRQPDITPIQHSKYRYRNDEDYTITIFVRGLPYFITIPAGFIYDGASVPRVLWSLSGLTPDGLIRAASLVHDWIYVHKGEVLAMHKNIKYPLKLTRAQTDRIFLDHMANSGMGWWERNTAFAAVRAYGWTQWKKEPRPIPMDASFERTKWWPREVELYHLV